MEYLKKIIALLGPTTYLGVLNSKFVSNSEDFSPEPGIRGVFRAFYTAPGVFL